MTQARCLWTWGNADHGKCGLGTYPDAPIFAHQQFEPAKVKEPELPGKLIQQVVCGGAHTLLVTASGRLLACGLGEQGQLGLNSLESHGVFQEVTGIESVSGAAAGHWHSLAVSKKGNVYSWGSNKQHQLGIPAGALEQGPTSKGTARPAMVAALRDAGVKQVACGSLHSMALTRDGEIYTWGFGKNGRLGHGDEEDQVLPKRLDSLRGEKIKAICAGYDVSSAISMAGKVWVWGYGFAWQLGQDDNKDRLSPTPLGMLPRVPCLLCLSASECLGVCAGIDDGVIPTRTRQLARFDVFDPRPRVWSAARGCCWPHRRSPHLGQFRVRGPGPGTTVLVVCLATGFMLAPAGSCLAPA